jgi:hypothetical protein
LWDQYCKEGGSEPPSHSVITNHMSGGRMGPRDFHLFGPLKKNTWLASDVQQTPTQSKLSPPSYRHWHWFLLCCDTSLTVMLGKVLGCHWWLWKSGVYHLLQMCHVHIRYFFILILSVYNCTECLLTG